MNNTTKPKTINILYALSDRNGTYSKYIGTSMCSVMENTKENVKFYLFHDGTLSENNIDNFNRMVDAYKQKIEYIDVHEAAYDYCEEARSVFAKAMRAKARYPEAAMYRLMAPNLLPSVDRLIYLDADTIVNMDIKELWDETLNESGMGVIRERTLLLHYRKGNEDKSDSVQEGIVKRMPGVTLENVFNSGVLLMDLNILRKKGDILIPGLRFLAGFSEETQFYDQDILNYYFAKTAVPLSWYYNVLIAWDKVYTDKTISKGIYHYMGHSLTMDMGNAYDILFYDYFAKTPWCNGETICKIYKMAKGIMIDTTGKTISALQSIAHNLFKKDAVIAVTEERLPEVYRTFFVENAIHKKNNNKENIKLDDMRDEFEKADIKYTYLGKQREKIELNFTYDIMDNTYVIFADNYDDIKRVLQNAGMEEYKHFVNGDVFTHGKIWLDGCINDGLFFSVI